MTLYDVLKASKGLPVSDMYAALWGKSVAESSIKTITGRLPIYFSTSENRLRDWVIYGNNNIGKNVIQLGKSQDRNNVTLTIDSQAGTVTMNGDTTALDSGFSFTLFDTSSIVGGDYIFSGGADGGSSTTYDLYLYNRTDQAIIGRLYSSSDAITVTIESDKRYTVYVQCRKNQVYDNIVFRPMLRKADTSSAFEPYQLGVGERTKNLFDESNFELVKVTATVYRYGTIIGILPQGTYTLTATKSASAPNVFLTTVNNDVYTYEQISNVPYTFTADGVSKYILRIGIQEECDSWAQFGYSQIMLVEGSVPPSQYIPYGYQIPLRIFNTGDYSRFFDTNVYIGDSPLTEGQSISMENSEVDILTFPNETNLLQSSLYNQPSMMIKYKE